MHLREANREKNNNIQSTTNELEGKYLTFWAKKQLFGMPIANVVQIIRLQEITEIPEFPVYAKGIINLRGQIIPVIDMGLRLGKTETEHTIHTCIIVTNIRDKNIGFIVESVNEVTKIEDEEVSPPPKVSSEIDKRYLTGVSRHEGQVTLLVDLVKVLGDNELSLFEK